MKIKLAAIIISMITSLLIIGTSYATDVISNREYVEYWYDADFTAVTASDNEVLKNVAYVFANIQADGTLKVDISTGYPGYEAYVEFIISNTGADPVYITGLTIGPYDITALDVTVDGITPGTLLAYNGDSVTGLLTVTILQDALQDTSYGFDVQIDFGDTYP